MIRLLHLADTHLGVENYGRLDPATGLSSRLNDFLAALDEAVDCAIADSVDLVVFAGDAYKTRDPSPTHQRELARRVRRLCDAGVKCFLLVGNHDLPNSQSRAHTTEIFDTLAVDGVTVARQIGTTVIQTRGGPVQVVALPWVTRSGLLAREESRGHGIPELNDLLMERLTSLVSAEIAALDPDLPAVLVGHCTVQGALFGSERTAMLGGDLSLPLSLLANPRLDYVALGHLHQHQVLETRPPVVYSGSIERVDFGEEGQRKGVVRADLWAEARETTFRFVPLTSRPFVTVSVTVNEGDPTPAVLEAIAGREVRGAIVRVLVTGATEVRLREAEVRKALAEASHVAGISQEVGQRARRRLEGMGAEGLTPSQALAAYMAAREMTQDHRDGLLARGRQLMEQGI